MIRAIRFVYIVHSSLDGKAVKRDGGTNFERNEYGEQTIIPTGATCLFIAKYDSNMPGYYT